MHSHIHTFIHSCTHASIHLLIDRSSQGMNLLVCRHALQLHIDLKIVYRHIYLNDHCVNTVEVK